MSRQCPYNLGLTAIIMTMAMIMTIITSSSIGTSLAESSIASTYGVVWEDAKAKRTTVFSERGSVKEGVEIYSDVCCYLFFLIPSCG